MESQVIIEPDSICTREHKCKHPHPVKDHHYHHHYDENSNDQNDGIKVNQNQNNPPHPYPENHPSPNDENGNEEPEGHHHGCCTAKPCFSQKTTFIINIVFNLIVFLVELILGHVFNSLSLISDSFHMLSDIISMVIGLLALIKASTDRTLETEKNMRYSYGFERYQILGSLFNGLFLIAFSFNICIDSLTRIFDPSPIKQPKYVLIAGVIGLVSNMISLIMFHGHVHNHKHEEKTPPNNKCTESTALICDCPDKESSGVKIIMGSKEVVIVDEDNETASGSSLNNGGGKMKSASYLNMFGVYLHIMGDFIGSILVIIVALLAMFINDARVNYADPVLSIILAIMMAVAGFKQLLQSIPTLLQQVPKFYYIPKLKSDISKKFKDVVNIHELHIWQLASSIYVGTMHIKIHKNADVKNVISKLHKYFHELEIHSMTIQPEIIETHVNIDTASPPTDVEDKLCDDIITDKSNVQHTCCPHNRKVTTSCVNL